MAMFAEEACLYRCTAALSAWVCVRAEATVVVLAYVLRRPTVILLCVYVELCTIYGVTVEGDCRRSRPTGVEQNKN